MFQLTLVGKIDEMRKPNLNIVAFALIVLAGSAFWQNNNFPDRKALILNKSPQVEITDFSFANTFSGGRTRFQQSGTWRNIGSVPIVAFEIVILKYDAFDQRTFGTRWTVTGKNSADWRPLAPDENASDAILSIGTEDVLTGIAYVRSVRLSDGAVWRANLAETQAEIRKLAPKLKEFGSLEPDLKQKSD